jgi:L-threonylcarbamoyladenylate synthase
MRTFKIESLLSDFQLGRCVECLHQGGIVCYPTETFYAIGADPWNETACERIYEFKGRNSSKDLPLIAANRKMIQEFCDLSHPSFESLAQRYWPGALTLVLPAKQGTRTYAVRISGHPVARQISEAFGKPITSTSANESGKEPVCNPEAVPARLAEGIDLLIDAGPGSAKTPSTIVSLLHKDPQILRPGIIPAEEILSIL